eukprot:4301096-Pyramimonas_sp.AAC.1
MPADGSSLHEESWRELGATLKAGGSRPRVADFFCGRVGLDGQRSACTVTFPVWLVGGGGMAAARAT